MATSTRRNRPDGVSTTLRRAQLPVVLLTLVAGLAAWAADTPLADPLFIAATLVALIPASLESIRAIVARRPGVDIIAVVAMLGAILLDEYLAGAIIALMLTGGETLEAHAARRARRELTRLLGREPRTAHRVRDGVLQDVDIDEVGTGDLLVVKGGEVVPTDGILVRGHAVLDEAALTGEARPVDVDEGAPISSGVVNAGAPFELKAVAPAAASTYRGIIRLVEEAAAERAPFVRMADRYATWFVAVTAVLATGAWLASGDPVRALAVLVVATPCPLILAAPAAIVSGLSRAARRGIIVKGGGALETLAGGEVVLLDKTGTVTRGQPAVTRVVTLHGGIDADEALRLAAGLDQMSVHPFAPAIVDAARQRGLALTFPTGVDESLGHGLRGRVGQVEVALGQLPYVAPDAEPDAALRRLQRRSGLEGTSLVYLAVDGTLAAALTLNDPVRRDAAGAIRALRSAGTKHVLLVTGDRLDVAEPVADTLGIDDVLADRRPEDKLDAVREAQRLGPTIMVGDGINDAPALALADVGVAMGARGATAASEAAEVVLTSGELRSLAEAVSIARRTRRIAWQSVSVGMGLSIAAMLVAAAGYLPPVAGALLQEAIDVAVIANALRALGQPALRRRRFEPIPERILADHRRLASDIDDLSDLAERLPELEGATALKELREVRDLLVKERLPHDIEEETTVYAAVATDRADRDPTAPLARSRREISRRVRLFARLVDSLPPRGPSAEDVVDLQRSLWGLHAILQVHDLLEDDLHDQVAASAVTTDRGRAP